MKIAVCGCSFSSPVGGEHAGTHWAEIVARHFNAELVVLARQGISNNVIRLQIDEAMARGADLVLINATTPDRIEFPVNKDSNKQYTSYVSFEDHIYRYRDKLKNFNYPGHDNTMVSETIFSVIDWPTHPYRNRPLSSDIKFAVKAYATCLYDLAWKTQCDNWIIDSGLWNLHANNTMFLYNPWVLNTSGALLNHYPDWFKEKYILPKTFNFYSYMRSYPTDNDPGYHTSPAGQQAIADLYIDILKGKI